MDLRAWLSERLPPVERALESAVPSADTPPVRLHAAMRHLLVPGGKRIRPAFALAGAEALGAPAERALPAAVAVELVHTFSLVHDDLPCMDDDRERRGAPTVHVAFDESTAVLAGDALQVLAFEALARLAADAPIPAERRLEACFELARAAGSLGLVGGQVDDLAAEGNEPGAAAIESIHERKTAALIAAAAACGALLAGAGPEERDRMRRYGSAVGRAFQIADDLLDAETGESSSLLRVMEAGAARERAQALLDEALAEIEVFGARGSALRELAGFAVRRTG